MPKVTSVEPQKKNPRRFNIFLDGQFAFGADEDLVVNRRLVPGKVILGSDLEKILFEAEVGKLMERLYRLFSIRLRSEKEARDYLKKLKDISPLVIEATIEVLKKKGLVDDQEFARAWVEARSKKYGLIRIKQELRSKGIVDFDFVVSNEEVAEKLLERKKLEKKKAIGFLLRRGFEYSVIEKVLKKLYN